MELLRDWSDRVAMVLGTSARVRMACGIASMVIATLALAGSVYLVSAHLHHTHDAGAWLTWFAWLGWFVLSVAVTLVALVLARAAELTSDSMLFTRTAGVGGILTITVCYTGMIYVMFGWFGMALLAFVALAVAVRLAYVRLSGRWDQD